MSDHDPFSMCDRQMAQAAQVAQVSEPDTPDTSGTPCDIVITPVTVISAVVSVLKQWFGSRERVTLDRGLFLWHPEMAKTQVFITNEYPWNLEGVSGLACLFVDHGNITVTPIRSMGSGKGNIVGLNQKTGETYCVSQYSADLSIRCLCRSSLEAWALANEVKCLFDTYADRIAREYRFNRLDIKGVIKPAAIKEYGDFMAASTVLNYTIVNTWGVAIEALPLKSIYGVTEIIP